jgi:hypothetical protein
LNGEGAGQSAAFCEAFHPLIVVSCWTAETNAMEEERKMRSSEKDVSTADGLAKKIVASMVLYNNCNAIEH